MREADLTKKPEWAIRTEDPRIWWIEAKRGRTSGRKGWYEMLQDSQIGWKLRSHSFRAFAFFFFCLVFSAPTYSHSWLLVIKVSTWCTSFVLLVLCILSHYVIFIFLLVCFIVWNFCLFLCFYLWIKTRTLFSLFTIVCSVPRTAPGT